MVGLRVKYSELTKAQKKQHIINVVEFKNQFLSTVKTKTKINSKGEKLLHIFCEQCKKNFTFKEKENF